MRRRRTTGLCNLGIGVSRIRIQSYQRTSNRIYSIWSTRSLQLMQSRRSIQMTKSIEFGNCKNYKRISMQRSCNRTRNVIYPIKNKGCIRLFSTGNQVSTILDGIKNTAGQSAKVVTSTRTAKDFMELLKEAQRRKYNVALIMTIVGLCVIYIFYGVIRNWASNRAIEVSSQTLNDPKFREELADCLEAVVKDVVKRPDVKKELVSLLEYGISTDSFKKTGGNYVTELVDELTNSDSEKAKMFRKYTNNYLNVLLQQLLSNPKNIDQASDFSWKTFIGAIFGRNKKDENEEDVNCKQNDVENVDNKESKS